MLALNLDMYLPKNLQCATIWLYVANILLESGEFVLIIYAKWFLIRKEVVTVLLSWKPYPLIQNLIRRF